MITINDLGGRKFLLCTLMLILAFLLILINRLNAEDYLKVAFAVIGLYTGLNVYQKTRIAPPRIDEKE